MEVTREGERRREGDGGCVRGLRLGEWSRKSTSGGMLTVDGVGVEHWSRTQKARAFEFWRGSVPRDGDGVR